MSTNEHRETVRSQRESAHAPQASPGSKRQKSLVQALIAAAREPMAVLDHSFRVTAANRPFYRLFPANLIGPSGRPFCELTAPKWSVFVLETLSDVVACDLLADDVEIDVDAGGAAPRRMLLNARRVSDPANPDDAVAIGLTDVTDVRHAERAKSELAAQQAMLLQEAHHRIANSLQIIASILLLKARSVESEETRTHLRDVHKRLILVAAVQRQLCTAGMQDEVEFGPYIAQLCMGLAQSMTDGEGRVLILSSSSAGKIKADDAISFGLIVTELVLNALKHGFPDGRPGAISVNFDAHDAGWRLSVSDDGVGYPTDTAKTQTGLGTDIVAALARHLSAHVEVTTGGTGSTTAIIHREPLTAVDAGSAS